MFGDLLTSNKSLAPATASRATQFPDQRLLLGILAGSFVLLQSNVPGTIYLFAHLLYAAFSHHAL